MIGMLFEKLVLINNYQRIDNLAVRDDADRCTASSGFFHFDS